MTKRWFWWSLSSGGSPLQENGDGVFDDNGDNDDRMKIMMMMIKWWWSLSSGGSPLQDYCNGGVHWERGPKVRNYDNDLYFDAGDDAFDADDDAYDADDDAYDADDDAYDGDFKL